MLKILLLAVAVLPALAGEADLETFETYVYGHNMVGRPAAMSWQVVAEDRHGMGGRAVTKTVRLRFDKRPDSPVMELALTLPAANPSAPVFLIAGNVRLNPAPVLKRGYGVVACRVDQIQSDAPNGYAKSIRGYLAPPGQTEPGKEEWGAIGAWAWGMSRAMDYLETDPDVDVKRVALNGAMRYAQVVLWAGAQDRRFALTVAQEPGFGTSILRQIQGRFGYWFDRRLADYAGNEKDLPVDWAKLVALHTPRPVYLASTEESGPEDARAVELIAQHAGSKVGYHHRAGEHRQTPEDWEKYLDFADRYWK